MNEPSQRDIFLLSVERCTASSNFFPSFYERFMGASDEVKNKFKYTDFEIQNKMLRRSLELSAGAISGDRESLTEIRNRSETHDRYHLDIKPRLYDIWLNAIIETASEYDDKWDDSVEAAWRKILGHVVKRMTRDY